MYDKMESKDNKHIYRYATPYTLLFALGCVGIMLVGPEVVFIFGGASYMEAQYVIPPVCLGIMFQFVYTLYANIEFYEKKTGWISAATIVAAILNIILNFLFIPVFGYIAAAYTTAIGFGIMFIMHYLVVRLKTRHKNLYDLPKILMIVCGVVVAMMIVLVLYKHICIRYMVILMYLLILVVGAMKYKKQVLNILKKR